MFNKKSKKRPKPPANLLLGIPTNIAAGPLGFRAELDIDPKDEDNPRPSRIVFCEREGGETQALLAQGTSMAVMIDGIEPGEYRSGENARRMREEDGTGVASRDRRNKTLRAVAIDTDVAGGSANGFGTLKVLLEGISAAHANYEVFLRSPALIHNQLTPPQGTVAITNKIGGLLARVVSLNAQFATRPGDVAEQRRRDELIRELKAIEGQLRSL